MSLKSWLCFCQSHTRCFDGRWDTNIVRFAAGTSSFSLSSSRLRLGMVGFVRAMLEFWVLQGPEEMKMFATFW